MEKGENITTEEIAQVKLNRKLYAALENSDIATTRVLLEEGADPSSFYDIDTFYQCSPEGGTALYFVQNLDIDEDAKLEMCKLLLAYRGYAIIDFPGVDDYSPLMPAVEHENYEMVKLLLDHGISNITFGSDFGDYTPYEYIKKGIYFQNHPKRKKLLKLLNDELPSSHLMINGENYIIHEYNEELDIEILGVVNQPSTKKYLYSGITIAIILYWVVVNNFYAIDISKVVKKINKMNEIISSKSNLLGFLKSIVTDNTVKVELLQKEFRDDNFIQDYLSLTLWKYSFHDDLKILFGEDLGFPIVKDSQETYQYILKLIDLRYSQYIHEWLITLNANQNKAELQALIEGKEPPKRVVDLSFLEEEPSHDDSNQKQDEPIIPDDFFITE